MLNKFFASSTKSEGSYHSANVKSKKGHSSLRSSSRSHSSRSKHHDREVLQRVHQICDWIQYFCGLFDGRFGIEEVEQLLLNPPVVNDDDIRATARPLLKFDELLRAAQLNPQDWFDFVVRHNNGNEMGEAAIHHEAFSQSLNKLASDFHRSQFHEEDIRVLYSFILKGHRHYMLNEMDEGIDAFDLAVAFAKFRMPAHQITLMNHVASQVEILGNVIRAFAVDLLAIEAISPKNARLGIMHRKELEKVIITLLTQDDVCKGHNNSGTDSISSCDRSTKSFLSSRTGSTVSDRSLFSDSSATGAENGKATNGADQETKYGVEVANVPLTAGEDVLEGKFVAAEVNEKPTRKGSMLGAVVSTLQSVAMTFSTKSKRDAAIVPDAVANTPNKPTAAPTRSSFFSSNNQVSPSSSGSDKYGSSDSVPSSTKARNQGVSRSFLDVAAAFDLRNQLAKFLMGDEAQRLHYLSGGALNLDINSDQPLMLEKSSKKHRRHRNPSVKRRYSALIMEENGLAYLASQFLEENEEEHEQQSHKADQSVPPKKQGSVSTHAGRIHGHQHATQTAAVVETQKNFKHVLEGFDARVDIVKSIANAQYGG
eukprot:gene12676-9067_t